LEHVENKYSCSRGSFLLLYYLYSHYGWDAKGITKYLEEMCAGIKILPQESMMMAV